MMKKKWLAAVLAGTFVLGLFPNGQNVAKASGDGGTLTIAYQYGLAYAPMTIMQEQGLIEKNYDGDLEVEWLNLNSGQAINEGVLSGE